MLCDYCDTNVPTIFVVQRRPSDPTELVCIYAYCEGCGPKAQTRAECVEALECGTTTLASTAYTLDDLFDSGVAARFGLAFLTI